VSNFVDESNFHVKGGDGGAGSVSFRRESHVPEGGPDGGDGGKGGDVWLVADHNSSSLLAFKDHPYRRAGNGVHGQGKRMHGKAGADTEVAVPEGTVVKGPDGQVLADLVVSGQRWLAGAGGRGGRGNSRFLTNRRRAPSFAEQGEVGEERWMRLELKLMADVALVGFPNVGKSTLIAAMSAARPKIADYPFTTLEPNLGVVRLSDDVEYVVADIPGLVEGAAEGRGLGHQFLRHVERARVLCILLDLAWRDTGTPDPARQQEVLLDELGRYQPDLLVRPRLLIGSRADIAPPGDETADGIALAVSGVTGSGVRVLSGQLATLVTEARAERPEPEAFVVHRPMAEGFSVERVYQGQGGWQVVGRQAERAVALSDLTNLEALAYAQNRLKSMGVDRALARAGAVAGEVVRIGTFTFEYEPDETVYDSRPTRSRRR
jgi:GTP-binding protein